MPHRRREERAAYRRVARYMRGLDNRLSDLEEERRSDVDPRVIRQVEETALSDDGVSRTVDTNPALVYDNPDATDPSGFDFGEYDY